MSMYTRWFTLMVLAPLTLLACSRKNEADLASSPGEAAPSQMENAEGHVKEDASAKGTNHIELTAARIAAAGIEVLEAGPAAIREALPLYGVIAPNAERVREVVARYPGVIRTVSKQIGDSVSQGETMATVESNESLQTYSVGAPLAGVITTRSANPGEQTGSKVLFTVADLSTVWVELSLFPRDISRVRVGQQVHVTNADGAMSASGKVIYVAPFGTAASQTLTARVQLQNPDRRWAPGLFVSAEVTLAEESVVVAVRNEALQMLDGLTVVFVANDQGFEPRVVQLGRADSEHIEVVDGLDVGESYASKNSFVLKAELGKSEAEHGH